MLVAVELEAVLVGHMRACLHAQQHIVRDGIGAVSVVSVVRGQQGHFQSAADLQQVFQIFVLGGNAVILKLYEKALFAENVSQSAGVFQGLLRRSLHEGLIDMAAQASRRGDKAFRVLAQNFPIDSGLVIVALQECSGCHLDEVFVADLVLGQQGEVVVELGSLRS